MRHVMTLVLLAGLVPLGCQKEQPKGPAPAPAGTPTADATPPPRPLDSLAPPPADTSRKEAIATRTGARPADAELAGPTPLLPPKTYTIQKGDTLYSVAGKLLGDPKRWADIKAMNPGLDEKSLPVGKAINIPEK